MVSQKLLRHTLGIETVAYTKQIGSICLEEMQFDDAQKNRYTNDIRCPDNESGEKNARGDFKR